MVFCSYLPLIMFNRHKKLGKNSFPFFFFQISSTNLRKKVQLYVKEIGLEKSLLLASFIPILPCLYYLNYPLICRVEMIVGHVLCDKTWERKDFIPILASKKYNDVNYKVFISCLIEIQSAKKRRKCKKIWWERHGGVPCADVGPVLSVFVHMYRMMIKFQITLALWLNKDHWIFQWILHLSTSSIYFWSGLTPLFYSFLIYQRKLDICCYKLI